MSACLEPHIWSAMFLQTVRRSPLAWELHQSSICHYESKPEECRLALLDTRGRWLRDAIVSGSSSEGLDFLFRLSSLCLCAQLQEGIPSHKHTVCGTVIRPGLVTHRSSPLPSSPALSCSVITMYIISWLIWWLTPKARTLVRPVSSLHP